MTRASRVSELPALLLIVVATFLLVTVNACQRAVFPEEPPGASDAQPTDSGSEPPILSIADASATESAGTLRLQVTLSSTSVKTVTVRYTTESSTAEEREDYTATEGTLTFVPGVLQQDIAVPIHQDDVDEADRETFTVNLAGAQNATLGDATATATILDDDVTVGVEADALTVVEGDVARFTVSLTGGPSSAPVAIGYQVAGTASVGTDYTMPDGSLTLVAGAATGTIAIDTLADEVLDPGETLQVKLHDASTLPGTVIVNPAKAGATITIADAAMVEVSVAPPAQEVVEGHDADLSVTLSGAVAAPVSLRYETVNETAEAGRDYTPTAGALIFAPGQIEQMIAVPILPDDLDEADERFAVLLTALNLPGGVSLGAAAATIIITDDDDPPVLSIMDATVVEGDVAEFVVSLDPASARQVTVAHATGDGTAQAFEDYTAVSSTTLTFEAGDTEQAISISTTQDSRNEDEEAFTVTLSNPSNATLAAGATTATGTIADDDALPVLSITGAAVSEGEAAEFVVKLSPASGKPVTVAYRTEDGTARAGEDYTAVPRMTLTFDAGDTEQTIRITTQQDTRNEGQEAFTVTLRNPWNATLAAGATTATGTITDDDTLPVLSITGAAVSEGEAAEFVVKLSPASGKPVTVAYRTEDGTARAGEDYTAVPRMTLTFDAGDTEQTIRITTQQDTRNEGQEAFTVTLSDPSNATLAAGATTATGTITDDDTLPVLSITGAAVSEGEAAEFVVTLSPASGKPVTVTWRTDDGTARAREDYTAVSSTRLTFNAGDTEQTIRITTEQDTRNEDQEAFTVTLRNPWNATLAAGATTATGTITDDDALPVLSITGAAVSEGEAAEFVVKLSPASGKPVTVAYRTEDGTARAGEDYTAVPRMTLTFDAGDTEQTIRITTQQDTRNEGQEAFTVTLSSPSNATLAAGAATATGTIADDDDPPLLSLAGAAVSEGETAEFVVTLSPASGKPVTVAYRTDDGTARAREDYTAVSSMTLTFAAGDTEQTISISTIQDTRSEDQETFTVTLSNPSNATLARHAATATGAITDDDEIRDDHGNTRSTATSVQPGTPISGRLETATDVDFFKVAVSSTSTLIAATDEAKAADWQHVEYRDTVVRIEGFGFYSSNTDSLDTAEVTVGVPGTYDVFVRVTSAHATYYDLAVWLINPEAPDWSFDIALRYLGTEPTAAQKSTIRAAARVWERVITRGLPDRPVASSNESCEDDDPSLFGVLIDDLLINIRLQAVDGTGGVLAAAGPCWIRSADGLPYLGDVLFDTADLASLELHDALGGTAAHEIAHVLGFGLLWDHLLKEPSLGRPGQDTHFDGQEAVAKFNEAGGDTYAGAKVPVENDTSEYGIGALDAHWRESVFGAEMMTTSVVIADPPEPLSAVTIASLADLGYEVDYSQAQSYLLPTAVSSRRAGAGAIRLMQLRNDIRRKPIRVGDPPELPIPVIAR